MKKLISIALLSLVAAGMAGAQQGGTLDQLLEQTRQAAEQTNRINQQREQEFINNRNQQRNLLAQARADLAAAERRSDQLKNQFDENEKALADLETVLNERMGNLGEMFGVVKQMANDLRGKINSSPISSQYPGRQQFLANLAQRKELPTIPELRQLWFEMQRELTAQAGIVQYNADVLLPNGEVEAGRQVARIGPFNVVSNGHFLVWDEPSIDHKNGILKELGRQPAGRFVSLVDDFENASPDEMVPMAIDYTSGVILQQVVETKTWAERIGIGTGDLGDAGLIGWVIIGVGILGILVALFRGLVLGLKGMKIKSQLKKEEPQSDNALGRVMAVFHENPDADVETLELKMDEAILRETGSMEAGLSFIKMLAVIAPLMGLLGTVVGMISTFQAITLFGTGDPKMMAGGISQALVTTVLGLVVAIPLTFLHSVLQSRSKNLIQILEEQSAGIVAKLAEKQDGVAV
ncbi:MAG: MotA/TolQ/ExbB proton channel family protein [Xanthomonadales bacterium]|nr:MotA/TolQ/ExbB proton channel family protein [Xanthomonadales bacterium]